MNALEFVQHLGDKAKSRKTTSGWQCCCPAHSDKTPSLSVRDGAEGRALIKCHAGCTPDDICAAVGLTIGDLMPPRSAVTTKTTLQSIAAPNDSFDWSACVAALKHSDANHLAEWRGLSLEFVRWLHDQKIIGLHDGKIAIANQGNDGRVVSAQVRLENGKWIYKPKGRRTAPIVFGDPKSAGFILTFESQWDAFAVMDKLGWHTDKGVPDAAILITCGASNGKLIQALIAPDAICYAFKQNDVPTDAKPITASDIWLADIASNAGCKVLNVATPPPHKDANDWTRSGATKEDIEASIAGATVVEPEISKAEAKPTITPEATHVSTPYEKIGKPSHKNKRDVQIIEPWGAPVNGADLLDGLAVEYRNFIVLPEHGDVVLALFNLHTFSWEKCEYSPILAITSPVRACGKSRVLDVQEKLVHNPFRTGNASEAVLFRVLDARKPTVLIDEFDTIPEERRAAIGNILKNGFQRSGFVHRIEGDKKREVVEFGVFGPKSLACIKLSTLDGATVSRCINIRMQRKKSGQKVARLRKYDGTEWKRKCFRWTNDNRDKIEAGIAEMPEELGDREQDIFEPLFVLANLAGGDWPTKIRNAALALCGESADAPQDTAVQLLGYIQTFFMETGDEKTSSANLVTWLNARADAPFVGWNDGRGIGQNDIRRHLGGFDIRPTTIRIGEHTAKGYALEWFKNAFEAYLVGTPGGSGNTVTTIDNIGDSGVLNPVTATECYQPEIIENANNNADCYPVTATIPETKDETLYV